MSHKTSFSVSSSTMSVILILIITSLSLDRKDLHLHSKVWEKLLHLQRSFVHRRAHQFPRRLFGLELRLALLNTPRLLVPNFDLLQQEQVIAILADWLLKNLISQCRAPSLKAKKTKVSLLQLRAASRLQVLYPNNHYRRYSNCWNAEKRVADEQDDRAGEGKLQTLCYRGDWNGGASSKRERSRPLLRTWLQDCKFDININAHMWYKEIRTLRES